VGNDGVALIDANGLVPVKEGLDPPNKSKADWKSSGENPLVGDMKGAAGFHIYAAIVLCDCSEDPAEVNCSVVGGGRTFLNSDVTPLDKNGKPETWPRVYGHEQRHINSKHLAVLKIVEQLRAEKVASPSLPAAKALAIKYQNIINTTLLDDNVRDHDPNPKGDPKDPRPMESKGYPPFQGSPPLPPHPRLGDVN
jgi:hypothetical protein